MNYPGLRARVRTTDLRPSLLVRSAEPIEGGRFFLVRLEADDDDRCRSLELGSLKQLRNHTPDMSAPFFSQPKPPTTSVHQCQKRCGSDQICVWTCGQG